MKKLHSIFFLFLITLSVTGCAFIESLDQGPSRKKSVTITGTAPSDLGQVLVFARDTDNKEIMFVKEFYSSIKSTGTMNREIKRYRNKINRLKNRRVTISYHENRAGNLVIDKITR